MTRPLFISIEGGDGAGKGTQIRLLTKWLHAQKIKFLLTREPGGCPSAETIRTLVVEGEDDDWDGVSELLLYSAARREHIRKTILPALESGHWVISDRFADSTTVYQGEGRGVPYDDIEKIHDMVIGENWPDLTIILDIDPKVGIQRSKANVHESGQVNQETRFENLDLSFHEKVRAGFKKIAAKNVGRCLMVDANDTPENVHFKIIKELEKRVRIHAA
ncbi:MAG: dTMP kinase [Magnetococcales bacterium]|nr:dTMP kinase [Magnetococcales bacterium]PPR19386.1 MAG: Thymidylate kinase [Pseudomonadota bacterium]